MQSSQIARAFLPGILKRRPAVSFVVPVFNKRAYLDSCIRSILAQDVPEVEIICIDDASTDGSLEVLGKYRRDRRVRIVRNYENRGAGESRNRGISLASADFIRFVDADDVIPASSSSRLLEAAYRLRTPLIRGNIVSSRDMSVSEKAILPVSQSAPVAFYEHESLRIPWYFVCYLIKRSELLASRTSFPRLRVGEDAVFLTELLCFSTVVAPIADIVYCYRSRRAQGRRRYSLLEVEDYFEHAVRVMDLFVAHNYERCWLTYEPVFRRSMEKLIHRAALEPRTRRLMESKLAHICGQTNGLTSGP